jgi:hypothetical protein
MSIKLNSPSVSAPKNATVVQPSVQVAPAGSNQVGGSKAPIEVIYGSCCTDPSAGVKVEVGSKNHPLAAIKDVPTPVAKAESTPDPKNLSYVNTKLPLPTSDAPVKQ